MVSASRFPKLLANFHNLFSVAMENARIFLPCNLRYSSPSRQETFAIESVLDSFLKL